MAKADNLLAVLWLLRSHRRMTATQLAESLEVSERTVYRYIDALCASGVPIVADSGPDGGYSLTEHFRGAPLFFDATELVALFQAARFARQAGYPHTEALHSALEKVKRNLAPAQLAELERHADALTVVHAPRGGDVQPWLATLEQAVAGGISIEMTYQKPEQEQPSYRRLDPYGLSFTNGLWYIVGFCHLRQELRDFRVDRIRSVTLTEGRFQRPPDFSMEQRYSNQWILKRLEAGPLIPLRIAAEPWAVSQLWDHWYLRHCRCERSAQEATFRIDPEGLSELPRHLLTLGSSIRIIEPLSTRAELARLAQAWAHHHGQPDPT